MEKGKENEPNYVNSLILGFFKQFSGVDGVSVETVRKAMIAYIDPNIAEKINAVAKEQGLDGRVGDFEMITRIKAAEKVFSENNQK